MRDGFQAGRLLATLSEIEKRQARQEKTLEALKARLDAVHDDLRRLASTTTRLKLMAENARVRTRTQEKQLKAIENRLLRPN